MRLVFLCTPDDQIGRDWANWSTPDLDERLTCTARHLEHARVVKCGDNLNSFIFAENKNYPVSLPGNSGEYLLIHAIHTGALAANMHFHGTKPSEGLARPRLIRVTPCRHPQEDWLAAKPCRLEAGARYCYAIPVIAICRAAVTRLEIYKPLPYRAPEIIEAARQAARASLCVLLPAGGYAAAATPEIPETEYPGAVHPSAGQRVVDGRGIPDAPALWSGVRRTGHGPPGARRRIGFTQIR